VPSHSVTVLIGCVIGALVPTDFGEIIIAALGIREVMGDATFMRQ